MKILIITTNGITSSFDSWPERLQARALVQRGHTVRALTYKGSKEFNRLSHEIIDGVTVKRLNRKDWLSLGLARELMTWRPDVVHLHHLSNQFAFETALICKLRRIPVVMTPHGLFHDPYLVKDRDRPFDEPALYHEPILSLSQLGRRLAKNFKPKRHLKNYLMHSPLQMMTKIIALSEHGRSVLIRLGIPANRIEVVPNAIDENWADAAQALEQTFEGQIVLYMGQLKYRKGFDLLAKASQAILKECPTTHFIFATHSPIHEAELRQLCEEAGTTAQVTILDNVSDKQKATLFGQATVYVLPTRYEGFGIPLIEAMSVGCPIVTTNISVIDELITNGHNGLLYELENVESLAKAVISVLQSIDLQKQLAAGGRQTVVNYYTPVIIEQLERIYTSVIKRS